MRWVTEAYVIWDVSPSLNFHRGGILDENTGTKEVTHHPRKGTTTARPYEARKPGSPYTFKQNPKLSQVEIVTCGGNGEIARSSCLCLTHLRSCTLGTGKGRGVRGLARKNRYYQVRMVHDNSLPG
jgi:hypothetical protein